MKKITYTFSDYILSVVVFFSSICFLYINILVERVNIASILIFLWFFLSPIYSVADMLAWRVLFDDTHLVARSLRKKETVIPYSAINMIDTGKGILPNHSGRNGVYRLHYSGGKLVLPNLANVVELVTVIEQYKGGHSEVFDNYIRHYSKKYVQKFYDEYGEENLKNEMQTRTIRRHILPNGRGEVYFTDRLVIDLNLAVFGYQDIAKIRVCNSVKSRYVVLIFTLKNGEEVVLCEDTRRNEAMRQDMLAYIKICKERNFKIEVDTKDLDVTLYMDKN